jgi:hypothetical protein
MKNILKVYLQTNYETRNFYWFGVGSDSSIYCGCSCSKIFTYGFKGTHKATPEGVQIVMGKGEAQSPDELIEKNSFHQSGIINLPTVQNGRHDRLYTKSLGSQNYPMPLFAIIPMSPTKYPVNHKKIKEGSLVINCGLNNGKSFGLIFFVSMNYSEPKLIQTLRLDGFYVSCEYAALDKYFLGVIVYHNNKFFGWPYEQIEVLPHPNCNKDLNWPLPVL